MKVEYYQTKSGKFPAMEFINSQNDIKAKNKILLTKLFLEEKGLYYSKQKNESENVPPYKNLYALRARWKNNWFRIFFSIRGDDTICYLYGIPKKSNQFSIDEVNKAADYAKEMNCRCTK